MCVCVCVYLCVTYLYTHTLALFTILYPPEVCSEQAVCVCVCVFVALSGAGSWEWSERGAGGKRSSVAASLWHANRAFLSAGGRALCRVRYVRRADSGAPEGSSGISR